MPNKTNQKESLAAEAYVRLEEMITTLELPPGHLMSEAELSRQIKIGRTPLREAIQRLVRDKLIEVLPRKGIMISDINVAEHLRLLETRRVLDRLVNAQAAKRISVEQRSTLSELAISIEQAADAGNLRGFMRLDKQFDEIVEALSRNSFAAEALAPLHAHCRRFWYMYRDQADLEQSAALHVAIIDAISEGIPRQAEEVSDQLIDYLKDFTRTTLMGL